MTMEKQSILHCYFLEGKELWIAIKIGVGK
jgi:hypothetical protein